jgi:hypothetical protein
MSTTGPGLRGQASFRIAFRVVGVVLLVVALVMLGLGLQSFFSSFGSDDGDFPSRFWMAFVGILLLAPATWCLRAGFLGVGLRYVAGETTPVLKDSAGYLTDGEGILGVGRTVDDRPAETAQTGPFCSRCGTRNDAEAGFCDHCGHALAG